MWLGGFYFSVLSSVKRGVGYYTFFCWEWRWDACARVREGVGSITKISILVIYSKITVLIFVVVT